MERRTTILQRAKSTSRQRSATSSPSAQAGVGGDADELGVLAVFGHARRGLLVGDRRSARIAVGAGGNGASERLDLFGRVEIQPRAFRLGATVGGRGRVARQTEGRLAATVVVDRADELARLVDGARSQPGRRQLGEHRVDIARGDLRGRPVAEGLHDQPLIDAGPATVRRPGLGEQVAVLAQRRRLGAADLLKPAHVRARHISKGG
jgi:hypothetical protein